MINLQLPSAYDQVLIVSPMQLCAIAHIYCTRVTCSSYGDLNNGIWLSLDIIPSPRLKFLTLLMNFLVPLVLFSNAIQIFCAKHVYKDTHVYMQCTHIILRLLTMDDFGKFHPQKIDPLLSLAAIVFQNLRGACQQNILLMIVLFFKDFLA